MALFEVPGWSVPDAPVATGSKKRKRPANDGDKLHTAEINMERLMSKLGDGPRKAAENKSTKKKNKKQKGKQSGPQQDAAESSTGPCAKATVSDPPSKKPKPNSPAGAPLVHKDKPSTSKAAKKNKKRSSESATEIVAVRTAPLPKASHSTNGSSRSGLTKMQAKLQDSLHGARFRWINETLYKSDSEHAHQMMRENPSVFSEYHTGFRHQVQSWPSNPVSHYVSVLSRKPSKTVIVDLGCGDAALAQALQPQGYTVLSYDLVSDGAYVTEADICSHIPLPGKEEDEGPGAAQVVDVVVCALSLMGTNWPKCIREAWRILRDGGELKIAEVASRFTNVEAFTSLICSVGFKLRSTDDSNTHFTLFEFTKAPRKSRTEKEWEQIMGRGEVLKPCEYKRR
ncbi:methyltransferase-domain-containing protein [Cristinia sonorae]|uniref:Ribosomal RNA-processing protein 8 n=1 Tax=Cristinia sonorae TaxID=1940300 RepID=A0A8K0UXF5_9AGAR|nr:methyltransferase-domain-containing protein [Cristinia sonorae]